MFGRQKKHWFASSHHSPLQNNGNDGSGHSGHLKPVSIITVQTVMERATCSIHVTDVKRDNALGRVKLTIE